MLMVHTALRIGCQDGADAIDERHHRRRPDLRRAR